MPRRVRVSPSTAAKAATGDEHPPSSLRTKARSARAQSAPSRSRKPESQGASSPARTWTARMPCPAAGSSSSMVKYRAIRPSRPSRSRPAAASTRAAYFPWSSFPSRVWTLPPDRGHRLARKQPPELEGPAGAGAADGLGRVQFRNPLWQDQSVPGSARREKPARGSRGSKSMGRSLQLWTVKSTRPSRRAASSSLTKRPLPPTWSRVRSRILSRWSSWSPAPAGGGVRPPDGLHHLPVWITASWLSRPARPQCLQSNPSNVLRTARAARAVRA